jgi:hypothetical protein
MQNAFDVLRRKEQELLKVKREVEALRTAAYLLSDDRPAAKATEKSEVPSFDFDVIESQQRAVVLKALGNLPPKDE